MSDITFEHSFFFCAQILKHAVSDVGLILVYGT